MGCTNNALVAITYNIFKVNWRGGGGGGGGGDINP